MSGYFKGRYKMLRKTSGHTVRIGMKNRKQKIRGGSSLPSLRLLIALPKNMRLHSFVPVTVTGTEQDGLSLHVIVPEPL